MEVVQDSWVYNGVEFQAGDRVMVVGYEAGNAKDGMGKGVEWENIWLHADDDNDNMDGAIYGEFVIDFIQPEGAMFVEQEGFQASGYGYPLSVLRKVH